MNNGTVRKYSSLIFLFILVLLIAGFAYYFYQKEQDASQILLHGNVDIRQVDLGFRVSGRLEKLYFEEGDAVKTGELLAQLDNTPYIHERNNLKAQVGSATANLAKLQGGNRPQEVLEAKAFVREKEAGYQNALKNLHRQEDLIKRNLTSKQAYDDAQTQEHETHEKLKTAQEALKLSEEGFRKEDIDVAKSQLESMQAQLASLETNLSDTKLYSPSDGILLTRIREAGSILAVGNPVYTLSLTNPIWVRAYTSEIDLGRIKPGMPVLVYTDTEPKNPFKGQIGFISPQAEFTPKNVETKELRADLVYRIRIVVQDPQGKLRQGMPVTVIIKLADHHA